jgi:3-oxoacyl-[acyl-carrier protein] reductase
MDASISKAFDLTGRVAVVTGAGGGIGREAAALFAAAGARVVIGDVKADGLFDTVRLVEAGIIRNNLVVDTSEDELDAVIAVNLKGVYFGCAAAARVMIAQQRGSIINVASTGMDMPVPSLSCYALTKAAVAMLTRTLATEVGPLGVRVNGIAPGFTDTPMTQRTWKSTDGFVDEQARDDMWKLRSAQSPLNRIGTARDQAMQMLYLASDASAFVTGQILRANGGVSMMP